MKRILLYAAIIVWAGCAYESKHAGMADEEANYAADPQLEELFTSYKEYNMRNYPEWATYEGDHRYNGRLTDNSEAGIKARGDSVREFLNRLHSINSDSLPEEQRLNYMLFENMLEEDIESEKLNFHYLPLTQQHGIHIQFPQMINYQPFNTYEDFNNYFSRLEGFPVQVDNVIGNMKKGLVNGYTQPKFIVEQILLQVKTIAATPTDSIAFMQAISKMDSALYAENGEILETELRELIHSSVKPAYFKLADFIEKEYLPAARTDEGVWALPEGEQKYRFNIRHHTTLELTPEEIFETGMAEVRRIKKAMNTLKDELGFKGSIEEFMEYLRTDARFYYTSKDSMMNGYREILAEMDTKLSGLFGRLPQAPYELKEIEAFRAASAPQAYYYSAPEDRSRPGYFYVNTYNLKARPKYTMTALALHEAVPGHHLQISIAQELEDLPWFRQNYSSTAFVEGWGLYAESLGYETGMYEDKYQHFGALTFEIWRACRLVVDVGIHHKKWTRQQAVDFMLANTPNSEADIRSEVDRYIVWPGQALAYKTGELKIKELRYYAEMELGDAFNVRMFHDEVLKNGPIPLPLLEENIISWVNSLKPDQTEVAYEKDESLSGSI